MLKIMKYLRPYALLVTAAIVLLFTQAMSELALPDYMSDIVNEGIQQGGITSAVPEAVRQDRMELHGSGRREGDGFELASWWTVPARA